MDHASVTYNNTISGIRIYRRECPPADLSCALAHKAFTATRAVTRRERFALAARTFRELNAEWILGHQASELLRSARFELLDSRFEARDDSFVAAKFFHEWDQTRAQFVEMLGQFVCVRSPGCFIKRIDIAPKLFV